VTRFQSEKTLKKRQGLLHLNGKTVPVSGYEIHSGVSGIGLMNAEYIDQDSTVLLDPLLYYPEYNTQGEVIDGTVSQGGHLDRQAKKYQRYIGSDNRQTVDGAISEDGRVIGTYLHGIFDQVEACNSLLEWAGLTDPNTESHFERQERGINQLANCLENSLDMQTVFDLIDKKR
jgi:adenosylcobyric acid synthase